MNTKKIFFVLTLLSILINVANATTWMVEEGCTDSDSPTVVSVNDVTMTPGGYVSYLGQNYYDRCSPPGGTAGIFYEERCDSPAGPVKESVFGCPNSGGCNEEGTSCTAEFCSNMPNNTTCAPCKVCQDGTCMGSMPNGTICGGAGEVCVDGVCTPQTPQNCVDIDLDGYGVCPDCNTSKGCLYNGHDCDDSNPSLHLSGQNGECVFCQDEDGDGYGVCPDCNIINGCLKDGSDCDDTKPQFHLGDESGQCFSCDNGQVAPNNCLPYTSELCGITNSASCAICKLNSDSGETYSDRCIGYTKNVVCEDGEDINYNLSGPFVGPAGCVCPLQFLYCGPTNGCKPIECPVAGGCSGNSYCKRTIANSGQVCEQKWIECPEMCFNNGNIITKFRIQQIEGYGTGIDSFVSGCMDTNQCLGEGKTNCGDGTCCINGSVCNPFGGCLKLNISASSAESNLNESYPSVGLFGLNSEKSPSVLDSVFSQITGFFANLLNMFS